MKSPFILATLLCITLSSPVLANPLTRRLVAEALKVSGRETLEAGAREAAERAAATAIQRLGGEWAEKLIQSGGYELLEAAARHGDDVLTQAARCPAAARYIGACPQEALILGSRLGDDAILLEARVPGMAEQAATLLGRESLPRLAQAPPTEVTRLIGYAARADSPATRRVLQQSWEKHGNALLGELNKHKTLILTGGLTTSMIMVADGVQDAIQEMPERAPEAVKAFGLELAAGISISLMVAAFGGVATFAGWLWLRCPSRRRA